MNRLINESSDHKSSNILRLINLMFHLYIPPENVKKTKVFLTFSEGIEMEYWFKWVNERMAILWTLGIVGLKIITRIPGNQAYFTKVTDQNVLEKKKNFFVTWQACNRRIFAVICFLEAYSELQWASKVELHLRCLARSWICSCT